MSTRLTTGVLVGTLLLTACGGGDDAASGTTGATATAPESGGDGATGEDAGTTGAPVSDGACWEADVTGDVSATLGDCDNFVTGWAAHSDTATVMQLRVTGEVLTRVDVFFPTAILGGGTYDFTTVLDAPDSDFGTEAWAFSMVSGTFTIDSQAADGSISGSFTAMGESSQTGQTASITGTFSNIPGEADG